MVPIVKLVKLLNLHVVVKVTILRHGLLLVKSSRASDLEWNFYVVKCFCMVLFFRALLLSAAVGDAVACTWIAETLTSLLREAPTCFKILFSIGECFDILGLSPHHG